MTMQVGRRPLLAGLLLGAAASREAAAQQIAEGRNISIVVPFGAGGAVDIVGRLVAQELQARLGQTVVVENRTGGGGNIAMQHVARATPDGTTLLLGSPTAVTNRYLYDNLTYDPRAQLAPIFLVGEIPSVMVCAPSFEAADGGAFVALARARPGHFNYGSGGAGTSEHLAAELLKLRAGLDIVHVSYRGGAPAMTDVAAGRVHVMFTNIAQALPLIEDGRLRALGVADQTRHPALPNVKTFAEMGVPNLNVKVWWGLMGPAGMPEAVVRRMNAALDEAINAPDMRGAIERLRARPIGGSVENFAQHLAREDEAWSQVIRSANIKAS
ncbi:MAG TPA: tripartite tricarboxylate transporter substrate binding protein [Falsiroseomonas sp.]|jgi:tripartite-type tricarboxylate transporter receptor subunit TctC|nr:tripartite tricarboxylate transporter substrate binding protein [Falsiroseomonas sp.]